MTSRVSAKHVTVNNISFNNDKEMFAAATDDGFKLFRTSNLEPIWASDNEECGPLGCAVQLEDTGVFVLSGFLTGEKIPPRELQFYTTEFEKFGAKVRVPYSIIKLLIRDELLVVVMEKEIQTYDINIFPNLKISKSVAYGTAPNTYSLCELSCNKAVNHVLVYPGLAQGSIQIVNLPGKNSTKCMNRSFCAHHSAICSMRLSVDGKLLATASTKGTLIRLWDTRSQNKLAELRRGADAAKIYDIDIDATNQFMTCISDKKTCHVFDIKAVTSNKKSSFSLIGQTSYSEQLRSFAQFAVPITDSHCSLAIFPDQTVVVITRNGWYYKFSFVSKSRTTNCFYEAEVYYASIELDNENDKPSARSTKDHVQVINIGLDHSLDDTPTNINDLEDYETDEVVQRVSNEQLLDFQASRMEEMFVSCNIQNSTMLAESDKRVLNTDYFGPSVSVNDIPYSDTVKDEHFTVPSIGNTVSDHNTTNPNIAKSDDDQDDLTDRPLSHVPELIDGKSGTADESNKEDSFERL